VTPAQVDPRAAAFKLREKAPLRFVLVVGNVGDAEVSEEEPTEGLGEDAELDADNAELGTVYDDDGVKGNVDNGDGEGPRAELETAGDRGVDVLSDEGAGGTVDTIAKNWGEESKFSSTLEMVN
jgi:hypothetical protein